MVIECPGGLNTIKMRLSIHFSDFKAKQSAAPASSKMALFLFDELSNVHGMNIYQSNAE